MSGAVASGGLRAFSATAATRAPDGVWRCWTTPATWAAWDLGLTSATISGPFTAGASVGITDRAGRRSQLEVLEVAPGVRCVLRVRLPGARLMLTRTLGTGLPATVRHEVRFDGPLALLWAQVLGRRLRPLLAETVDRLVAQAQAADGGPG